MNINICLCTDDNYTQHCAVTMASILYNSDKKDKYHIYIISDYISKENQKKLKQLKSIRNFKLDFLFFDYSEVQNLKDNGLTLATYYRYKIFDLIKDDKLLYLDVDLIIRKDIKEMYKTDLGDYLCAAVEDIISESQRNFIGAAKDSTYVNAGVILFNLKKCREENISQKLKEFLKTPKGLEWHDQHTLNYIFQTRIKLLDITWNHMYNYKNNYQNQQHYHDLKNKSSIAHFITADKPWVPGCNPNLKMEYFKYLRLTPYYKDFIDDYIIQENQIIIEELKNIKNLIEKNELSI